MHRSFNTLWKQLAKYLKRMLRDMISIPIFGHLISSSLFIGDYLLCAAGYSLGITVHLRLISIFYIYYFHILYSNHIISRDKIKHVYLYRQTARKRSPTGIPSFVVSCTGFLWSRFYARNTFPQVLKSHPQDPFSGEKERTWRTLESARIGSNRARIVAYAFFIASADSRALSVYIWRRRNRMRGPASIMAVEETMDNSPFKCTQFRCSWQTACSSSSLWSLLKESLSPYTQRRGVPESVVLQGEGGEGGGGGGEGGWGDAGSGKRKGGRRAKRNDEGGGPCYTTLVHFVVGTRQRCSTYTTHFARSPRFRILKSGSILRFRSRVV